MPLLLCGARAITSVHAVLCSPTSFTPRNQPLSPLLLLLLQVFQFDMVKAWGAVVTTLVSVSASLYLISVSPWYLLPFAWFIAGTAFTGVRACCSSLLQPVWCSTEQPIQH
jgi:hypothetical protein